MRRCIVVEGPADALVAGLPPEDVLVVGPDGVPAHTVRRRLGASLCAVVLDLREGLDADLLAQAMGFVREGGALVLRMPAEPPPGPAALAVVPYGPEDVGHRLWDRLVARLPADSGPVGPCTEPDGGTEEQARVVDELVRVLSGPGPAVAALVADRGRGKSAALGLALRRLAGERVVLTAPSRDAVVEVLRFAGDVPFVEVADLMRHEVPAEVVVVDEAAQLPVPILERLVARYPDARLAFATTARGYEGTGRGFVLRFLARLRERGPVVEPRLRTPIRWNPGDPLEALIFDALCLDADAAELGEPDEVEAVALDRDALAADEQLLRDFFGLLVHAHYRTTPSDLHRILDAPNLDLHALLERGRVVGATVVAHEGGLDPALCDALFHGERRIRGHALPETLVCHSGRPDAGELTFVRSVRIAIHPERRLRGLARRLVEHVHATYAPDLFGTVFGATPELLRFRRACGYELVRVGSSKGARTGEPGAVMLRPVSEAGRQLVADLRHELARDLPVQLSLLDVPDLEAALALDLVAPEPRAPEAIEAIVRHYALGPRPYEAAAAALEAWVPSRDLTGLEPSERDLVRKRILERRPWPEVAGDGTVPTAMRALRRAVRRLL